MIYEHDISGAKVRVAGDERLLPANIALAVSRMLITSAKDSLFFADVVKLFGDNPALGRTPGARYITIQRALTPAVQVNDNVLRIVSGAQTKRYQKVKRVVMEPGRLEDVVSTHATHVTPSRDSHDGSDYLEGLDFAGSEKTRAPPARQAAPDRPGPLATVEALREQLLARAPTPAEPPAGPSQLAPTPAGPPALSGLQPFDAQGLPMFKIDPTVRLAHLKAAEAFHDRALDPGFLAMSIGQMLQFLPHDMPVDWISHFVGKYVMPLITERIHAEVQFAICDQFFVEVSPDIKLSTSQVLKELRLSRDAQWKALDEHEKTMADAWSAALATQRDESGRLHRTLASSLAEIEARLARLEARLDLLEIN